MLIKINSNTSTKEKSRLFHFLDEWGFDVIELSSDNLEEVEGNTLDTYGILGYVPDFSTSVFNDFPCVVDIINIPTPYKFANRIFTPKTNLFNFNNFTLDREHFMLIGGPCSVESEEQITTIAREIKNSGAKFLRGGAFKPRSSPYSFQGLELEGLDLLKKARKETGLPIVTEIISPAYIDIYEKEVDIIQVGARNMQNFELLKAIGRKTTKPIILKRGMSSTVEEWLMAAEYIMASGNKKVILCERGIRTFENGTRNTLDLSAIPAVKRLSHLPIIVDPSHATGNSWMIRSLSLAAVAAGADGLMVEVHNNPEEALCDGPQSITPEDFSNLVTELRDLLVFFGKSL